ncbi:hypothetical protein HYC85_019652 [Camellia sinensis]|uniref:Uncharacterized protein n=1 Tax=Camellia sinensis TaxID=4442 RepID=A0A7J7GMS7_CAMSI|nr:hypothetical protein HYC85_019652 [Camellia sinensis]
MAAKAGYLDLVKLMTTETVQVVVMDNSMLSSETRSVVHAALRGRNIGNFALLPPKNCYFH